MDISITDLLALLAEVRGSSPAGNPPPAVGKYCIVRCRNAGVHAGIVERADSEWTVLARGSRRLWKWHSGFTLSEAATTGIDASQSRVAVALLEPLSIPTVDVAELLICSDRARRSMEEAKDE